MPEPLYQDFIVKPQTGSWVWFHSPTPIPWPEARDRIIAAGVAPRETLGRFGHPKKWMLSVSSEDLDLVRRSGTTSRDMPA